MFLFLNVYISIYLSIIHVYSLVVIMRLPLDQAAIEPSSGLHRSPSLFYQAASVILMDLVKRA